MNGFTALVKEAIIINKAIIDKSIKILLISIIAFCWSCTDSDNNHTEQSQKAVDKKAIMEINGTILYEEDFYNFTGHILREMGEDNFKNAEIKEQLLKDFTEHYLLLDEADKRGITADTNTMEKVSKSIQSSSGSQNLRVYSGHYDTDSKILTKLMQQRLIVEILLREAVNSRVIVTEDDIKSRYQEKEAKETPETKAHILHIFTLKE